MSEAGLPDAWWGDDDPAGSGVGDRGRPEGDGRGAGRREGRSGGGGAAWPTTAVADRAAAAGPGSSRPDPRRGPPVVEPGPPSSPPRQVFVPPPEDLPPFEDDLAAAAPPPRRPRAPVAGERPPAAGAPAPRPAARARPPRIDRRRLAVVYDIEGPRVRLGVAWFAGALVATAAGTVTTAVAFAVAAGFAGRQVARAWGSVQWQADVAAGIGALPVVAAAVAGVPGAVGAAVLGLLAAAGASWAPDGARLPGGSGRVAAAGIMALALVPALGGVGVVLVRAESVVAAVVLVVVSCAYEAGDYVVGSGASNPIEGPLAGVTTATLVALPLALVMIEPYDAGGVALVVLAAAACPFGQIVASAALPGAAAHAPALRRVDTFLVLSLIWAAAAAAL